jgi:predicted flap endonuclease-1-like 5' DNA nuclease
MLRLRDEKKEVEHTLAKMQVEARVRTVSAEANDTQTLSAETLVRDELTRIRGIGRVLSEKLGEAGVTSFHQLATLSPEQMEALDVKLGLRGRMQRDRWQEQARALHEEIYGKAKG